MKSLNGPLTILVLTFGLATASAVAVPASGMTGYQAYPAPYTDLRGLVDRTQSDLREAAGLEHHGGDKQRDRYRSAQEHLSTFDRHLTKGHFDKDELDKSIDSIKDILDHNTLQASSRDALMRDVEDLRMARDRRW